MRYEWIGTRGQKLFVEKDSDGLVTTTAGPDDLEAQVELLKIAERLPTSDEIIALRQSIEGWQDVAPGRYFDNGWGGRQLKSLLKRLVKL